MLNRLLISTALVAAMGTAASAATVTVSQTLGDQTTNYSGRTVGSIAQFDSSLGTLNSATVTLLGTVSGSINYESLDAAASNVQLNLSAEVAVSTGMLGQLVVVLPTLTQVESASIFDGTIDFGGTSGGSVANLSANLSNTTVVTGGDLTGFIGGGFVDFTLDGTGLSSATGPGNLATIFQTLAGGTVTVVYDYTVAPPPSAVPLPAGMPLLLLGMGAMGLAAKRRKA